MALVLDGTNGVSGVDGTASNPSLEGTDSNTGVFFPAADTVAIGTGGTERLRVDSAGNVGIGTTSPDGGLDVEKQNSYFGDTTNGGRLYFRRGVDGSAVGRVGWISGSNVNFEIANDSGSGNILFQTNSAERMRLDANGNLGIGTTTLNQKLNIYGDGTNYSALINFDRGGVYTAQIGTDGAGAIFGSTSNHLTRFITNSTERARITSDGFFKAQGNSTYINSTAPSHEFINATNNNDTVRIRSNATSGTQYGLDISTANDQNDATRYFLNCSGSTTQRATIRSNGGLANYSANNVNLASDQRLKKDISLLDTSWDKVKQIEVVNFRYKDCNEGDPLLYGVIAQQVQPIVPELVVVTQEAKEATEDAEATPEYFGIREQPMYWLAIKALQEAMTRIEQLEAKVAALENA